MEQITGKYFFLLYWCFLPSLEFHVSNGESISTSNLYVFDMVTLLLFLHFGKGNRSESVEPVGTQEHVQVMGIQ